MRRNAVLFVLISVLSGFGSTAMTLAAGIWVFDLTGHAGAGGAHRPVHLRADPGRPLARCAGRPAAPAAAADLVRSVARAGPVEPAGGPVSDNDLADLRGAAGPRRQLCAARRGRDGDPAGRAAAAALGDVNGWRSSGQEGMKLLAPLAGAGLFAWRGPMPVVLLCAVLPLLTAACYALLTLTPGRSAVGKEVPAPGSVAAEVRGSGGVADEVRGSGGVADKVPGAGDVFGKLPGAGGGVGKESRPSAAVGEDRRPDGSGQDGPRRGEIREGLVALLGNAAVRGPVLMAATAIGLSGLTNAAVLDRVVHGWVCPPPAWACSPRRRAPAPS